MGKINIDSAIPGMILSANIEKHSRLLLPAGVALTAENISILKKQGIATLQIASDTSIKPDEESINKAIEYTKDFFLYVDNSSDAIQKLFDISADKVAQKIMKGWKVPSLEIKTAAKLESMRDLFFKNEGTIEDIVHQELKIASFPDIFIKVNQVVNDPQASSAKIAEVVGLDVGLSTQLLKLVNSALYGFPSEISSLSRAVTLIGGKELSSLALGLSTVSYFKDIPPELMDMKSFWYHSLTCGVFAKVIAEKVPEANPEEMFTAGLLHDVGRLVLLKEMPYSSIQSMLYARENFIPIVEAEDMVLGFNHADISDSLLKSWNFPEDLTSIISNHHSPSQSEFKLEAAILQVADNLALATGISEGGLYVLPGFKKETWAELNLNPKQLELIAKEQEFQISELFRIFF